MGSKGHPALEAFRACLQLGTFNDEQQCARLTGFSNGTKASLTPETACDQVCEDSPQHRFVYSYFYPVLSLMCIAGNTLNVMVYSDKHFDGTQTKKFFIGKAAANVVLVTSMMTNLFKVAGNGNAYIDWFFWESYPFVLCVGTSAQCVAIWLTLMITVEMLLCILLPMKVRDVCSSRLVNSGLVALVLGSVSLQAYHVIAQTITTNPCQGNSFNLAVKHGYEGYEKAYFWLQTLTVIVPFLCMLVICGLVMWKFQQRTLSRNRRSSFKVCIMKIAFATMLSHLVFESTLVYLTFRSAFGASHRQTSNADCTIVTVGNFLCLANASWSFFIYAAVNQRFRELLHSRLRGAPGPAHSSRISANAAHLLSETVNSCRADVRL